MSAKKNLFLLLLFVFTSFLYTNSLQVAAVQLEISKNTYSSVDQFRREMENNIIEAVNSFDPDLIIFPEYASVFPAITPYYPYLEENDSIENIFLSIHRDNKAIRTLKDIFITESSRMEEFLSVWGDLAEKYEVTVVGGSYFAWENGKLTNRLIVYGPEGNRIYEQDKFFLTDFETDIIGLNPGSPSKPDGIMIEGKNVVFTICRDTFLDRWEPMYSDADLWIDIKANGEVYGEEQVSLFSRALPARMKDTSARYGATVCLTGRFLELFWEGESSFIGKTAEGVHTYIRSDNPRKNDILYFVVD